MASQPHHRKSVGDVFASFANSVALAAGSPAAFSVALISLVVWALAGPYFDYSSGWQLVINTGTTIVTLMMVFVIQNSQNREGMAVQIKLDEIIRASGGAKNTMIDQDLAELRVKFAEIAEQARKNEEKVILREERVNGKSHKGLA